MGKGKRPNKLERRAYEIFKSTCGDWDECKEAPDECICRSQAKSVIRDVTRHVEIRERKRYEATIKMMAEAIKRLTEKPPEMPLVARHEDGEALVVARFGDDHLDFD